MAGHIPRRETASNAKELDTANKENRKLKREVAKLQKYVAKLLAQQAEPSAPEDESCEPLDSEGVQCPVCEKQLSTVNLGLKTLRACKNCGWRKVA